MGYSRAVVKGDWCFVSGTTGYDHAAMTMPDDPCEQARNCFRTIFAVLGEAGFAPGDIMRVRYTVTDAAVQLGPAVSVYLDGGPRTSQEPSTIIDTAFSWSMPAIRASLSSATCASACMRWAEAVSASIWAGVARSAALAAA